VLRRSTSTICSNGSRRRGGSFASTLRRRRRCIAARCSLSEPDLSAWLAGNRLNLLRALPDHAAEPSVQAALERYLTNVEPAIERLEQLNGSSPRVPACDGRG